MNIAIFADVHGRVLLCFKLCARWQRETGKRIDLILQCGDLGAFPDPNRLDRTTFRHARYDSSELGFSQYFTRFNPQAVAVLVETTCPLIFVRGNHEDHAWLDSLEAQTNDAIFPVDVYERVWCLRTGMPYTHRVGDKSLTVLGVGRTWSQDPRQAYRPQFIQPDERERIYRLGNTNVDVLLTHESARNFVTQGYGMKEIRNVLNRYRPPYHFYGHTNQPCNLRSDVNGMTTACKLTDLHWDRFSPVRALRGGGMGILRWHSPADHHFEVVDVPWWTDYTAHY